MKGLGKVSGEWKELRPVIVSLTDGVEELARAWRYEVETPCGGKMYLRPSEVREAFSKIACTQLEFDQFKIAEEEDL